MQFDIKYNTTGDTRPITTITLCNLATKKSEKYQALLDTGANYSLISTRVAEALGIKTSSEATFNTASAQGVHTSTCEIGVIIDGKVINALAGIIDTPDFEVVIGMNVIGITRFSIEPKSNKLKVTIKI